VQLPSKKLDYVLNLLHSRHQIQNTISHWWVYLHMLSEHQIHVLNILYLLNLF